MVCGAWQVRPGARRRQLRFPVAGVRLPPELVKPRSPI